MVTIKEKTGVEISRVTKREIENHLRKMLYFHRFVNANIFLWNVNSLNYIYFNNIIENLIYCTTSIS